MRWNGIDLLAWGGGVLLDAVHRHDDAEFAGGEEMKGPWSPERWVRPTALAQLLLAEVLGEGDLAIDATCGNGHDTRFLAQAVGPSGKVLAFDVQEAAIVSARKRVSEAGLGERVAFYRESHSGLERTTHGREAAAVMFNLGYLPGADHALATEASETLAALAAATRVLKAGGALSVVCYPGHEGGDAEAAAVEEWMAALAGEGWKVLRGGAVGTLRPAPFLLFAVKPRR